MKYCLFCQENIFLEQLHNYFKYWKCLYRRNCSIKRFYFKKILLVQRRNYTNFESPDLKTKTQYPTNYDSSHILHLNEQNSNTIPSAVGRTQIASNQKKNSNATSLISESTNYKLESSQFPFELSFFDSMFSDFIDKTFDRFTYSTVIDATRHPIDYFDFCPPTTPQDLEDDFIPFDFYSDIQSKISHEVSIANETAVPKELFDQIKFCSSASFILQPEEITTSLSKSLSHPLIDCTDSSDYEYDEKLIDFEEMARLYCYREEEDE